MRRLTLLLVIALLIPVTLTAQALPTSKLAWSEAGPSLTEVQTYTYRIYADGSTTGQTLAGVTCSGTVSPFSCEAPFPPFTPGNHNITLTALNAAGESAKQTSPFAFTFIVTPATPTGLGIK